MTWLRLDDQFDQHPKVAPLSDREFRVHIRVLCYCARYRTKGRIPESVWSEIRGLTRPIGARLEEVGLWDREGDVLSIHDWKVYNGDTIEEQIKAYLASSPEATANEVYRAVGGKRELVLGLFKLYSRFPSGTGSVPDAVPERYPSGTPEVPLARTREPHPQPLKTSSSDLDLGEKESDEPDVDGEGEDEAEPETDFMQTLRDDLAALGVNGKLEQTALEDPERAAAWVAHIDLRDDIDKPKAFFRSMISKGGWPDGAEPPHQVDLETACRNFVAGYGWDETFTTEMVREEFDQIARLAHVDELSSERRDALLEEWRQAKAKRYPEVEAA